MILIVACQDIDDALHARKLPNGNFEVGVHIADVTHFVKPNTAMDDEAKLRGTTVYLVDKRIDMLPMMLGTDLCSLVGGRDRYAVSVLWVSPTHSPPTIPMFKNFLMTIGNDTRSRNRKRRIHKISNPLPPRILLLRSPNPNRLTRPYRPHNPRHANPPLPIQTSQSKTDGKRGAESRKPGGQSADG